MNDDELRRLLHDAVDDVEPRPALDAVQARTKVIPMKRSQPWIFAALGAAAAVAATVGVVSLVSDDGTTVTADPTRTPRPTASVDPTPSVHSSPPPSDSGEPAGSGPTPTPGTAGGPSVLPVYFAGQTSAGTRLFREFHRFSGSGIPAALTDALVGAALDPDYSSDWPGGIAVAHTSATASRITIDLTNTGPVVDLTQRPDGLSGQQAFLAVQQLVYTVQGAAQARTPVTFTVDGRPVNTLLGVDVRGGVPAHPQLRTLAPVWITTPQDGDSTGGTIKVTGQGSFFEANASWQLLDGTTVVQDGFTTAKECCVLAPYSFTITGVDPGTYTVRVFDAGGLGDSKRANQDTKTVTVQ